MPSCNFRNGSMGDRLDRRVYIISSDHPREIGFHMHQNFDLNILVIASIDSINRRVVCMNFIVNRIVIKSIFDCASVRVIDRASTVAANESKGSRERGRISSILRLAFLREDHTAIYGQRSKCEQAYSSQSNKNQRLPTFFGVSFHKDLLPIQ